jgi:hypothetical protein
MEGHNNRVVKRSLLFHPIKARSHSAPYVRSYNSESMSQKPRVITRTSSKSSDRDPINAITPALVTPVAP